MAKIPASLGALMHDPSISISSSPFSPGHVILKRPSFPKGRVPPHLTAFLIGRGECAAQRGVVTGPRGNPIPRTAACVRERHRRGGGA